MANQISKFLDLQVNDIIVFTNKIGYKVQITVSRIEDKSWYCGFGSRNSYGTLKNYMKYPDFEIIRNNILIKFN